MGEEMVIEGKILLAATVIYVVVQLYAIWRHRK